MKKVLIIDDDVQATSLLAKVLTISGYDATPVNISATALDTSKNILPDLILLDLMMPDPNGFEVCKMLRAESIFADTPIVIISALDDSASKQTAYDAGATDYMVKPLHMDILTQLIESLL